MNLIRIAWRNVGRNTRRSILSGIAITVATMSIVTLFSLLEGMKADLSYNLTTFYTGEVQLRNPEYGRHEHLSPLHLSVPDVQSVTSTVSAVPGVEAVVPRLSVPGAVFQQDEQVAVQAVGVDFAREATFSGVADYVVGGDLTRVTDAAEERRVTPVLVGNGVLDRLDIGVGDQFTVVVRTALRGTNAMTFEAAAVADFPVPSLNRMAFWAPLDRVQRLARMPDQAGEVLVKLAPGADRSEVMDGIRGAAPDLEVRHFEEIDTSYGLMQMATVSYNMIALIFFLLASTVIVNTTMMVIFERRQEIGMLEALGMHRRELMRLFLSEALIIGVIGATVGLALGTALSLVLGQVGIDLGAAMEGVDFEISPVLYPRVNLRSTALVFAFSVVVSGLTSYVPTRRITKIEPVAALREE